MNNKIQLVVFDMAGTTVNERNVVYHTIYLKILEKGIIVTESEVLRFCAGKEKLTAIKDILIEKDIENHISIAESIFKEFKPALKEAYQTLEVEPCKGVLELFIYLKSKGIKIALNTGYDRNTANGLLKKLNWSEDVEYDTLVTADDVSRGRPFPDMIHLAMKNTGIEDASNVVKIGDSMIDIEEGKSAKCGITIGVTTGAQDRDTLKEANPTAIFDTIFDLASLV